MALLNLNPEEHGEHGSPYPFWIRCSLVEEERHLISTAHALCGAPGFNGVWSSKHNRGYMVAMFRNEDDRTLVRLAL